VDFQFYNGNLERNAGRGSPFARLDMQAKKAFKIPHTNERVRLELQADALNILNHTNYQNFVTNDVVGGILPLSPDPNCVRCTRLNGTLAGADGRLLKIQDLRNGKVSPNLLDPLFGPAPPALGQGVPAVDGIGDPVSSDVPRTFQLSFHVRF
jgi:hypothetical protein